MPSKLSSEKQKIAHSTNVNDHVSNITIEHWQHAFLAEEDKYIYVQPCMFYPNFKIIMDEANKYFSDDIYKALDMIDFQLLRFTLWLNNNHVISSDYVPEIDSMPKGYEEISGVIKGISNIVYLQIAPHCFTMINSSNNRFSSITTKEEKKKYEKKSLETFTSCHDILVKMLEVLPKEKEQSVSDFANNVFKIIDEQGI